VDKTNVTAVKGLTRMSSLKKQPPGFVLPVPTHDEEDRSRRAEVLRKLGIELDEQRKTLAVRGRQLLKERRQERKVCRDVFRQLNAYTV